MQQIDELTTTLNLYFQWNKARMDCFVGMVIGLLKLRNINLTELAMGFPSTVKLESRYRRIQRFISDYPLNFGSSRVLVDLVFQAGFWPVEPACG